MAGRSEWSTVFQRFPAGRVPIVGSIGIFVHDWSRPSDGHPRLFDRRSLEVLTTAHPSAVATVYSSLALALIVWSVHLGFDAVSLVVRIAIGAIVWTLAEYIIHRYAFHFVPGTRWGVALAYLDRKSTR